MPSRAGKGHAPEGPSFGSSSLHKKTPGLRFHSKPGENNVRTDPFFDNAFIQK